MSPPQIANATKPSLAQDWLNALGYWLGGRRGLIALIVLAVVIGAALNWSWLVAAGVVPLLLTVLPCLAMCGLGLCMSRMGGGSCSKPSSGTDDSSTVMAHPTERSATAAEPDKGTIVALAAEAEAMPDHSTVGAAEPVPDHQPQTLNERK